VGSWERSLSLRYGKKAMGLFRPTKGKGSYVKRRLGRGKNLFFWAIGRGNRCGQSKAKSDPVFHQSAGRGEM